MTPAGSHAVPKKLGTFPQEWARPYARLVDEFDFEWRSFEDVQRAVRLFLDPILSGDAVGSWSVGEWRWK